MFDDKSLRAWHSDYTFGGKEGSCLPKIIKDICSIQDCDFEMIYNPKIGQVYWKQYQSLVKVRTGSETSEIHVSVEFKYKAKLAGAMWSPHVEAVR